MYLALAAVVVLALALKKGQSDGPATPPSSSTPPPPQNLQLQNGASKALQDVVGGVGAAATAAGAVVGLLKTAGVFAGGGGAAAGSAAATGAATGGGAITTTGGTAGGGAALTTAGGVSASVVAANVGIGALILAIEIAVAYVIFMFTETSDAWSRWTRSGPQARLEAAIACGEAHIIQAVVDPSMAGVRDANGKAVTTPTQPEQRLFGGRSFVHQLSYGERIDEWWPIDLKMPAAELLRLYRTARYLSLRGAAAYNHCQYWFYRNGWGKTETLNPRGLHPDRFWAWVHDDLLPEEPWAEGAKEKDGSPAGTFFRCVADYATLERAARSLLGPNFDLAVINQEWRGRVGALTDAAITGYPWLVYQGDEIFTKNVVIFSGLVGASDWRGAAKMPQPAWGVQQAWVNGGCQWVAIDPVSRWGIDLVNSRRNHTPVLYSPELLEIGARLAPVPYTPPPAFADVASFAAARSLPEVSSTRNYEGLKGLKGGA